MSVKGAGSFTIGLYIGIASVGSVSLDPSIGNWSFPCRSHYWIRNNRVHWAGQMSRERIEAGRAHDRLAKARFNGAEAQSTTTPQSTSLDAPARRAAVDRPSTQSQSVWARFIAWWKVFK